MAPRARRLLIFLVLPVVVLPAGEALARPLCRPGIAGLLGGSGLSFIGLGVAIACGLAAAGVMASQLSERYGLDAVAALAARSAGSWAVARVRAVVDPVIGWRGFDELLIALSRLPRWRGFDQLAVVGSRLARSPFAEKVGALAERLAGLQPSALPGLVRGGSSSGRPPAGQGPARA